MPRARTICKIPGCGQARYTHPYGGKSIYCHNHVRLRNTRHRDGLPGCTRNMLAVLKYLLDMKRRDHPFVALSYPDTHPTTLNALLRRHWIEADRGEDGTRYYITKAGERALKVYTPARNRRDGICPLCGVKPRAVSGTGRRIAYCLDCERARARDKSKRQRQHAGLCSRCHRQPRRQYPSGVHSAYCTDCERERSRERSRREQVVLLERIRAGGPVPPCKVKGCNNPRQVFANSISGCCASCNQQYRAAWKFKRALRRNGVPLAAANSESPGSGGYKR